MLGQVRTSRIYIIPVCKRHGKKCHKLTKKKKEICLLTDMMKTKLQTGFKAKAILLWLPKNETEINCTHCN